MERPCCICASLAGKGLKDLTCTWNRKRTGTINLMVLHNRDISYYTYSTIAICSFFCFRISCLFFQHFSSFVWIITQVSHLENRFSYKNKGPKLYLFDRSLQQNMHRYCRSMHSMYHLRPLLRFWLVHKWLVFPRHVFYLKKWWL